MATQIVCDECGEPIDQSQAYYQIVATKMVVENANDPSLPNTPTVVEIAQTFDYHDGHQPKKQELPLKPTHPIVEPDEPEPEPEPTGPVLNTLDPSTAAKGPFSLRALGERFTDVDVIVFNNSEVATTYVSETELTADIDTSSLGKSTYFVLVRQGNDDSDPLPFVVT
jgi:hypothetical protein